MRHAKRSQSLSAPAARRGAMLDSLVKNLIEHGQITTTHARAKEAQRLADRLVTLGKDGSIHARRRAFRVLQSQDLVGRLFKDVAPRFVDVHGGYTRGVRLAPRPGDGATPAVLAFSRLPAVAPETLKAKAAPAKTPTEPSKTPAGKPEEKEKKGKGLLEGIRSIWTRKKKGSAAP